MKTVHFRNPGKPLPVLVPTATSIFRQVLNKPPKYASYYRYPINNINYDDQQSFAEQSEAYTADTQSQYQTFDPTEAYNNYVATNSASFMTQDPIRSQDQLDRKSVV